MVFAISSSGICSGVELHAAASAIALATAIEIQLRFMVATPRRLTGTLRFLPQLVYARLQLGGGLAHSRVLSFRQREIHIELGLLRMTLRRLVVTALDGCLRLFQVIAGPLQLDSSALGIP
jgi:hypothetical protein